MYRSCHRACHVDREIEWMNKRAFIYSEQLSTFIAEAVTAVLFNYLFLRSKKKLFSILFFLVIRMATDDNNDGDTLLVVALIFSTQ